MANKMWVEPARSKSVDVADAPIPRVVLLFTLVNAVLYLFCLSLMSFWRYSRHLSYPFNTPFFPVNHLYDIWCFTQRFTHVHTREFFSPSAGIQFQYPAAAGIIYFLLFRSHHPFAVFFLSASAGLLLLGTLLQRHLRKQGLRSFNTAVLLACLLLFSFPVAYEFVQANIEVFIVLLLALALFSFLSERYYIAAVLIGIAAAIKIFPFVFFGLFLPQRRWRQGLAGIACAIIVTLVSLWLLCPDVPYSFGEINHGLAINRETITLFFDKWAIGFDHSLFGFLKVALQRRYKLHYPDWLYRDYMVVAAAVGIALWFGRLSKLPLLNKIIGLSVCAILLPPTSYEYTVMHMYVAWGVLTIYAVALSRAGVSTTFLAVPFLCFAVLFSPMSEIIVSSTHQAINLGAQVKCIALVILLICSLRGPWPGIEEAWNTRIDGKVLP